MTESNHGDTDDLMPAIIAAIRTVTDPEIPVNLYDLGLIYDLDIGPDNTVRIRMTLTTPNCPVAETMPEQVRKAVQDVEGVQRAEIELVWEPAWTADCMSDDAKLVLEMMGVEWSDPLGASRTTNLTVGRKKPGKP